jgi:hypothetical protein
MVRDGSERRPVVFFDDGTVQGAEKASVPQTLRADDEVGSIRKGHKRV